MAATSLNCELIVFDRSGDVFLTLKTNEKQSEAEDPLASWPIYAVAQPVHADDGQLVYGDDDQPVRGNDDDPTELVPVVSDTDGPDSNKTSELPTDKVVPSAKPTERELMMQVSSKHLSLASKVFHDMFQDQPMGKHTPQDPEPITIPLQNDDYQALRALLYIIHGHTRRVSRTVTRDQLLQLVKLIDKYEFHEVAEVFTDMWFEALQPQIPRDLQQDTASWIYICLELRKETEYTSLTEIAIREVASGLENPNGLVPYWVVDQIQTRRCETLSALLLTFSTLLELYSGSDRQCYRDTDCDALALGKLIRALKQLKLYPVPEPWTLNISIETLFSTIRQMDLGTPCRNNSKSNWNYVDEGKSSHLNAAMRTSLSSIEDTFRGLSIDESSREANI